MVDHDDGAVRSVAWSQILPWLNLFCCFRIAVRPRALLLSAAAVVLCVSGWALFAGAFCAADQQTAQEIEPYRGCPWLAVTDLVRPGLPEDLAASPPSSVLERTWEPFCGSWEHLSRPARGIFRQGISWARLAFLLLSTVWAVAVWAFFGGAITRMAAVELASGERLGWGDMMRHAGAKWLSYFFAPLLPLLGVFVITAMIALAGLVLLHFDVGVLVAGLVWPLLLLGGLLMAILLLGLVFGWPLMWATISAEGTDSFDALSRAYAYVFGRPWHYLFYAMVAIAIGALSWLLVSNFAAAVISLTYWAASWGGTADRVAEIMAPSGELGRLGTAGATLIRFWGQAVALLAVGFLYSYFWTASTAIYFLLRYQVDATEMDEVFLEEEEEQAEPLPPLETDQTGATVVSEQSETNDEE